MSTIRILCIGDVVGPTGCAVLQKHMGHIKKEYGIDVLIVNGENRGPRPQINLAVGPSGLKREKAGIGRKTSGNI